MCFFKSIQFLHMLHVSAITSIIGQILYKNVQWKVNNKEENMPPFFVRTVIKNVAKCCVYHKVIT